jgi:hypothetical protein
MAHPLGSNFRELIGIVRYQPTNRLNLNLTFIASKQGLDSSSVQSNFGGNISRPNTDILDRTNVTMFQGVENIVQSIAFTASYMAYHNLFIDAGVYNRSVSHEINGDNSSTIIHLGLRLNTELFKFE